MKVVISNEAKKDINNIFDYITKNSLKYAIETTKNIRSNIHDLELSPYLGRYVPELSDNHLLELIYKSYRIVYEIFEDIDIVYIHFIIHGKRDFKLFYNSYLNKLNF